MAAVEILYCWIQCHESLSHKQGLKPEINEPRGNLIASLSHQQCLIFLTISTIVDLLTN